MQSPADKWWVPTLNPDLSSICAEDLYGKLVETGGGKERMMAYWGQIGYTEGNWELAKKLHERKTKIFSDLIASGKIPLRAGRPTFDPTPGHTLYPCASRATSYPSWTCHCSLYI